MNKKQLKKAIKNTFVYRLLTSPSKEEYNRMEKANVLLNTPALKRKAYLYWVLLGIPYYDFVLCRCRTKSFSEASRIVTYRTQKSFYFATGDLKGRMLSGNKYASYKRFEPFYQREVVCYLPSENLKENFIEAMKIHNCLPEIDKCREELWYFAQRHDAFVVKPFSNKWGIGVKVVKGINTPEKLDQLLSEYSEGFVAEELIAQSESMAVFHPNSVNTVRVNTVVYDDGSVEVKWPCFRMGAGGSFVDNAGSGGIVAAVDATTGKLIAASDEKQAVFTKHPDTGVELIGATIPRWDELCECVKKMALLFPECRFVGWDMALTDNGWVLVELNTLPMNGWQIASGIGVKKEFNEMKRRFGRFV